MENIILWVKANWLSIGVIILAVNTCLKAIRDALDKTPATDDNWFEKLVTILGKASAYIVLGKRADTK